MTSPGAATRSDPAQVIPTPGIVRIAVVIPCYKVSQHILAVISGLGPEVTSIYVIDDKCPEDSGKRVETLCMDPRVKVLFNNSNLGVGGSVMCGYQAAVTDGADVIVKVDGDGQMDSAMLPRLVAPILRGHADYAKGNRFYDLSGIRSMPMLRVIGNSVLSFMAKLSTGYWGLFDPANGYTAIHANVAAHLPRNRISQRYFFETDMLFRLNILRAVVVDIPMEARYGNEVSNLKELPIAFEFTIKHLRNFLKRIFYNYFLRDMSIASLELVSGTALLAFGVVFGAMHWARSLAENTVAPTGVVMLAALPVLVGLQLLLAFLGFDMANVPKRPVHGDLPNPVESGTYIGEDT
jgi:glycosyltransferase involved in cell wall biosynthesis